MAGIGFRLQALLSDDSYSGLIRAYIYSALVSTGPWLLSILNLSLIIAATRRLDLPQAELSLFNSMVVYAYAGSLVLTGIVQLATTRYTADRLFAGDHQSLSPCYHQVGAITVLIAGMVAAGFLALSGMALPALLGGVVLFQAVSLTWIGMIFLSAAKDYMAIVRAYAIGYGLSTVAAVLGALWGGFLPMLWGFALGQVVVAALQGVRIRVEFPSERGPDRDVVGYWRRMPALILIGLFYNLGIWVDKFAFWAGPYGNQLVNEDLGVEALFFLAPRYDACIFLAYLTIVPALSLFMIRIEVAFYRHYAAFYAAITQGADWETIKYEKDELVKALTLSAARLLRLQGSVTLVLLVLAPAIAQWIGFPPDYVPLMRLTMLAAFTQVMLHIVLIVLLYFDWQRTVAIISVLFFIGNLGLSVLSFHLDERFHGMGYLIACLAALVAGLVALDRRLRHLEYETFAKQAMVG